MNLTWDIILLFVIFLSVLVGFSWLLVQAKKKPTLPAGSLNTMNVLGHNVHYVQEGTGPHLILVHGIGASAYVWRRLFPLLSQKFTVTALDLIGFGLSDKPLVFKYDLDSQCQAVLDFLDKMKIQTCYLAGSSMGGAIVLRLAQMQPQRFSKIIAIAPAADPKLAFFDLRKLSFLSPLVQPIITEKFIKQIMKRIVSNKELITDEALKIYTQPYKQKEALLSFTKSFSLLRDARIFTDLDKIHQPVLVLWGEKDKIIPFKYSKNLLSKIKNITFHSHPHSGHHPHEDEPSWTSEKIIQFLTVK